MLSVTSTESTGLEDSHHDSDATIVNDEMAADTVDNVNDEMADTVNNVNDEHNSDKDRTEKETLVDWEINEWEEYDAAKFGGDIATASSSTAGPFTITAQAGLTATTKSEAQGTMNREATLVLEDPVISNLLSSQQSFYDLNLSSYEDPYSANIDFGVDF